MLDAGPAGDIVKFGIGLAPFDRWARRPVLMRHGKRSVRHSKHAPAALTRPRASPPSSNAGLRGGRSRSASPGRGFWIPARTSPLADQRDLDIAAAHADNGLAGHAPV